jgi:hypothetical protein
LLSKLMKFQALISSSWPRAQLYDRLVAVTTTFLRRRSGVNGFVLSAS